MREVRVDPGEDGDRMHGGELGLVYSDSKEALQGVWQRVADLSCWFLLLPCHHAALARSRDVVRKHSTRVAAIRLVDKVGDAR